MKKLFLLSLLFLIGCNTQQPQKIESIIEVPPEIKIEKPTTVTIPSIEVEVPKEPVLSVNEQRAKYNQERVLQFVEDAEKYAHSGSFEQEVNRGVMELGEITNIKTSNPNSTVNIRSAPNKSSSNLLLESGEEVIVIFCFTNIDFCGVMASPVGLQDLPVLGFVHSDYLSY